MIVCAQPLCIADIVMMRNAIIQLRRYHNTTRAAAEDEEVGDGENGNWATDIQKGLRLLFRAV